MPAVREGKPRRQRKDYKPVAKEDRRNLKAWAHGAPESILEPHIAGYTDSLERGFEAERDYLLSVYQEYHARIDWRIDDFSEIQLPLPEFDKFALPVVENLTDEDTVQKRRRVKEVNARIRRWLRYRARKLRASPRMDPRTNPFAVLLAKLADMKSPPKARQAFQQYMHESYESEILPTVEARWATERTNIDGQGAGATQKKPDAPFRARVARELFSQLDESEQLALKERAQVEAQAAREEYQKAMKQGPSKEPAARQRCIDNLGSFMAPILQGIQDYTGLHSVVIFGGPFPRYGGELKTLHVSYGRNHSAAPVHMPQWAKHRFDRDVIDLMKAYLETAFTPVERKAAALPETPNPLAGAKYSFDDEMNGSDDQDGSDGGGDGEEGSGSESDSESGSGSGESDSEESESESDPEMDDKERKRREREKTKKRNQKEKAKAKAKIKRRREKEKEKKRLEKKVAKGKGKATEAQNKRKREAGDPAGKTLRKKPKTSTAEPLSYDEERAVNMRRNKEALAAIDARLALEGVLFGPDGIPFTTAELEARKEAEAEAAREKEAQKVARSLAAAARAEQSPAPLRRSGRARGDEIAREEVNAGSINAPTITPGASSLGNSTSEPVPSAPATTLDPLAPPGPPTGAPMPTPGSAVQLPTTSSLSTVIDPPAPLTTVDGPAPSPGSDACDSGNFDPPAPPMILPTASDSAMVTPPRMAPPVPPGTTSAMPGTGAGKPAILNLHHNGLFRVPVPPAPSLTAPPALGGLFSLARSPLSPLVGRLPPPRQPSMAELLRGISRTPIPPTIPSNAATAQSGVHPNNLGGGSGSSSEGGKSSGSGGDSSGRTSTPPTTSGRMTPAPSLRPANWTASALEIPPCPTNAPQWFRDNYNVITVEPMGAGFNVLLGLLVSIEKGYKWKTSSKGLSALGRPKEVSVWMGAGRGLRGGVGAMGPKFPTPSSKTVNDYSQKYQQWWTSIQPKWRIVSGTSELVRDTGIRDNCPAKDWQPLRAPGQNDIFLALLMLYWWRRELPGTQTDDQWKAAATDMQFMLEGLDALQKREAGGNAGTDMETDELCSDSV